jgi:benzoyl-CoA reductase/2-hydroxyglutaryl-CoA dehydratase subunit BcrC/BadD/HgdB
VTAAEERAPLAGAGGDRRPIGWSSIYTPEEILWAAGLAPRRIMGEGEGEGGCATSEGQAATLMHSNVCSYVLGTFEEGLAAGAELDGIVLVNECDGRRRLYDLWKYYVKPRFIHMLDLPKTLTPESTAHFERELRELVARLRAELGAPIGDDELRAAIALWNELRRTLARVPRLRARRPAALSGSEALGLYRACLQPDKRAVVAELTRELDAIETRPAPAAGGREGPRILLAGSYFDARPVVQMIEADGAVVVGEDASYGQRYAEGLVDEQGDPIAALARYYLGKAAAGAMADVGRRVTEVRALARQQGADAIVYAALKFCDKRLVEFPAVNQALRAAGAPVLFIEWEHMMTNYEQVRTRLSAFVESVVGQRA